MGRGAVQEEGDINHCHEYGGQLQFTALRDRGREKDLQDKEEGKVEGKQRGVINTDNNINLGDERLDEPTHTRPMKV